MTFKTRGRTLKPFLFCIFTIWGNFTPTFNAVLNFVWSPSRVKNKYQRTKQVKQCGNHYNSFHLSGVKSEGPKFASLLPRQRFFCTQFRTRGIQLKGTMHKQCWLLRDKFHCPQKMRGKVKVTTTASFFLFFFLFLFLVLAMAKNCRRQKYEQKSFTFIPLIPPQTWNNANF